jgi:hypothetical protein
MWSRVGKAQARPLEGIVLKVVHIPSLFLVERASVYHSPPQGHRRMR